MGMYKTKPASNFKRLEYLYQFFENHNGFIAGGCFKNIFSKTKIKDIDIFFRTIHDYVVAVDKFISMPERYQRVFVNDNASGFLDLKTNMHIDLCCRVFGSPEDVIGSFDFTVTQFVLYKVPRGEERYRVKYHPLFFYHLHSKQASLEGPMYYGLQIIERIKRYRKYGYSLTPETFDKVRRYFKGTPKGVIDKVGEQVFYDHTNTEA